MKIKVFIKEVPKGYRYKIGQQAEGYVVSFLSDGRGNEKAVVVVDDILVPVPLYDLEVTEFHE